MRWLRRTLRRVGVELPFNAVICPEAVKTVSVDGRWKATVTVRRTLVFLEPPEPGDLRDVYPIDPSVDRGLIHESPDARVLARRRVRGGTVIYWEPRDRVVPYTLYVHEQSWSAHVSNTETTMLAEMQCDMRTGAMVIEMVAPMRFQAAIAFRRPRFPRLNTERRLMEYALAQLETGRLRPVIRENRQRAEWRFEGPRAGDRYVCIAFTAEGLDAWRQHLRETTFAARLKRLFQFGSRAGDRRRAGASIARHA